MKFKALKESYINDNLPFAMNWYLGTDWVKEDLNDRGYDLEVDESSEEVWDELGEERSIKGVVSRGDKKLNVRFIGNLSEVWCEFTDAHTSPFSLEDYSPSFHTIDDLSKYIVKVFEDKYGNE